MTILNEYRTIVERYPNHPAIQVIGGPSITHSELWERGKQTADVLQIDFPTQGQHIGVLGEKSEKWIEHLIAIWMAGHVAVPLASDSPQKRQIEIVRHSQLQHILSQNELPTPLSNVLMPICSSPDNQEQSPAYLLYSSGTTGKPKGVLVSHRGLSPMIQQQIKNIGLEVGHRSLWVLSPQFDASLSDIWVSLCSGACLFIDPNLQVNNTKDLLSTLHKHQINYVDLPPSILVHTSPEQFPESLKCILVGGEVCPSEVLKSQSKNRKILVSYGPTEATVCTSIAEYTNKTDRILKGDIGHPLKGVQYRLEAESGELLIAGPQVAIQYWKDKSLSEAKFVHLDGQRWYRSGDLVAYREDRFQFIGRIDRQFKVRGKWVAPEEIEHHLCRIDQCSAAVVFSHNDQLWAGLEASTQLSIDTIKTKLSLVLPQWMIPQHIKVLGTMPRGVTGKLDIQTITRALISKAPIYKPEPRSLTELLCHRLGLQSIPRDTPLQDMGMDSLTILEVISYAEHHSLALPPKMFETPLSLNEIERHRPTDPYCQTSKLKVDFEHIKVNPCQIHHDKGVLKTLLTGATGALGAHLLSQLIAQNTHPDILVRAHSISHAKQRLKAAFEHYQLNNIEQYGGQIHRVDLCDPSFKIHHIASEDTPLRIIHAAACTDLFSPYDKMVEINVSALLKLLSHPNVEFHYMSTMAIFLYDKAETVCSPKRHISQIKQVAGTYAQTKWLAEWISTKANAFIYRLGLLFSPNVDQPSPRNWFNKVIKGIITLGMVPENTAHLRFDLCPLDHAAKQIILNLTKRQSLLHIHRKKQLTLGELVEQLRVYGHPIEEVTSEVFIEATWTYRHLPAVNAAHLAFARFIRTTKTEDFHVSDLFLTSGHFLHPTETCYDGALGLKEALRNLMREP